MTDKELKRMGRAELMELLIAGGRERDALAEQADELNRQLSELREQKAEDSIQLALVQQHLEDARKERDALQEKAEEERQELVSVREELKREREQTAALREALSERDNALAEARETFDSLSGRVIESGQAGTLADAALQISGVFEAAQKAADQYLLNIKRMQAEQARRCEEADVESRQRAEQLIREAEQVCAGMEAEMKRRCGELDAADEADVRSKWNRLSDQLDRISMEIRNSVLFPGQDEPGNTK